MSTKTQKWENGISRLSPATIIISNDFSWNVQHIWTNAEHEPTHAFGVGNRLTDDANAQAWVDAHYPGRSWVWESCVMVEKDKS